MEKSIAELYREKINAFQLLDTIDFDWTGFYFSNRPPVYKQMSKDRNAQLIRDRIVRAFNIRLIDDLIYNQVIFQLPALPIWFFVAQAPDNFHGRKFYVRTRMHSVRFFVYYSTYYKRAKKIKRLTPGRRTQDKLYHAIMSGYRFPRFEEVIEYINNNK